MGGWTPAAMADAASRSVKYTDEELATRAVEITQKIKNRILSNEVAIAKRFFNLDLNKEAQEADWEKMREKLFKALDGESPDKMPFVRVSGFNAILE